VRGSGPSKSDSLLKKGLDLFLKPDNLFPQ
jgi:hypothetical protein